MRIVDFSDGFESASEPTQTVITANALKVFVDDAAFVTAKGSVAAEGDIYYNSTSDLIKTYTGAAWISEPARVESLSQFAATTSAQLAGVISDETGSGSLVFATSPTLITPALGTPSALVGTNITGTAAGLTAGSVTTNANLSGDVTSVGNATTYNGTLPLLKGGTGQTTKAPAFDALSPMTTGGDLIYGGASGTGTRLANGTAGQILTSNGTTLAPSWATSSSAPDQSYEISNLSLATSVSASALTISVKTKAGSDASGGDTIKVGMRSSTLSSGVYNQRTISAALSLVISSGSTLGQTSTKPWVQWIYLIDNAGTLELAVCGTLFNENQLTSTTAEGGAGAADSVSAMYSTTARTNVPFRLIGKLINTQTTAGTWASAGTTLQVGNYGSLAVSGYPTAQVLTSGTTYYTPAGCTNIRVRMVGGGGGGAGGGSGGAVSAGGTGGNTTFGSSLLTANGGVGGTTAAASSPSTGGAVTVSAPAVNMGSFVGGAGGGGNNYLVAGYASGVYGASTSFGGGGAGAANSVGGAGTSNTGAGGAGGGSNATGTGVGGGGAAGGFVAAHINNPLSAYAYAIGGAGTAGAAGTNGFAGGAGATGIIIVEEFYN
jgi:hypothetical protein